MTRDTLKHEIDCIISGTDYSGGCDPDADLDKILALIDTYHSANGLKALDAGELFKFMVRNGSCASIESAQSICAQFGAPVVPSVDDIQTELCTWLPESSRFKDCVDCSEQERDCARNARAIHALLTRGAPKDKDPMGFKTNGDGAPAYKQPEEKKDVCEDIKPETLKALQKNGVTLVGSLAKEEKKEEPVCENHEWSTSTGECINCGRKIVVKTK
jgi:hypothetical protein